MKRTSSLAAVMLVLLPAIAAATSIKCILGTSRCIQSQGTEIPSAEATEILARCEDFTLNDLGRIALRLSYKEINDKAAVKITPLVLAWFAFDDLRDSPLAFEREPFSETNYDAVKRACNNLNRDFYDDSKWTK